MGLQSYIYSLRDVSDRKQARSFIDMGGKNNDSIRKEQIVDLINLDSDGWVHA